MNVSILFVTTLLVIALQMLLPFFVKRTVVFGVTIPVSEVHNRKLFSYKVRYAALSASLSLATVAISFVFYQGGKEVLPVILLPFIVLFLSTALYFLFHVTVLKMKRNEGWFQDQRQVHVTEWNLRAQDAMLSLWMFLIPTIIIVGVGVFSFLNYPTFPAQIPTHWGPGGEPDAFTDKSMLAVLTLPITGLMMTIMFAGINELTRRSGIKLSAGNIPASKRRQLRLRKYTSWLLFLVSILTTVLFSYLQFTTVSPEQPGNVGLIIAPLLFAGFVTIASIVLAVKVGTADSDFDQETIVITQDKAVNIDDDTYWKAGIFYFNREDPSIFVEKRFGIGFSLNFAKPLGLLLILLPLIVIVFISNL